MAIARKRKTTTAMIHSEPGTEVPTASPALPPLVTLRLPIETRSDTPTYYINHAEVNLTPFEMAVTFSRLPPRFTDEQNERLAKGEAIHIPPIVQILLPLGFVSPLIEAMGKLKTDYEQARAAQAADGAKVKSDE